jgi:hypothetical protein
MLDAQAISVRERPAASGATNETTLWCPTGTSRAAPEDKVEDPVSAKLKANTPVNSRTAEHLPREVDASPMALKLTNVRKPKWPPKWGLEKVSRGVDTLLRRLDQVKVEYAGKRMGWAVDLSVVCLNADVANRGLSSWSRLARDVAPNTGASPVEGQSPARLIPIKLDNPPTILGATDASKLAPIAPELW